MICSILSYAYPVSTVQSYRHSYSNKANKYSNRVTQQRMDPHKLREQIKQKFKLYEINRQYTYDEVLFILDQQCQLGKCDRDVTRELYDQSLTPNGKANLD